MTSQEAQQQEEVDREELARDCFMEAAAASAMAGVALKHGGPFGACVVRNGVIISCAHNTVLSDRDPTCHAEMNAIRDACKALDTHDLSDCELFTTCEPCPQCLGAIQWSRLKKTYTGVDRFTAAEFGFDDKVFYDEISAQSGHWAVKLGQTMPNVQPSMLNVYFGVEMDRVSKLLVDLDLNKTYRRRVGHKELGFHDSGERFGKDIIGIRAREGSDDDVSPPPSEDSSTASAEENSPRDGVDNKEASKYFDILEDALREAVRNGENKEREVFASCVVKDGQVISVAVNQVLKRRDCTATSEVLAIRKATRKLKTHDLHGCQMYSTMEPCLMSLGAVLWSRIDSLYYGLSQHAAARHGFEEGLLHYREVFSHPDTMKEVINVEPGIASEACSNVFKRWQKVNGIIY
ncbi:tRNA-specific adenosine deaminase [Hondaea fermentalgiana]|uniref:tRNA-specific adenosine deaminase n=1 Tax=Hondaea fermentalgiana TaxID=2315210 RepID=A0A2R5G2K8_9STRA|nr:tRNA-specific adenosine deaminase [Hondaea fermentalgiana]|eukprot:GBG25256.1 tRNA-specific adenosine deaminase [Hondaea fermentalgiana]